MSLCRLKTLASFAFVALFVAGQSGVGVASEWLDSAPLLTEESSVGAEESAADGKAPGAALPDERCPVRCAEACGVPMLETDSALAARAVFDLLPDSTGPPAA